MYPTLGIDVGAHIRTPAPIVLYRRPHISGNWIQGASSCRDMLLSLRKADNHTHSSGQHIPATVPCLLSIYNSLSGVLTGIK